MNISYNLFHLSMLENIRKVRSITLLDVFRTKLCC